MFWDVVPFWYQIQNVIWTGQFSSSWTFIQCWKHIGKNCFCCGTHWWCNA